MEPVPTQDILKVEATFSNECVEQQSENMQTTIHEDLHKQSKSTGTSVCNPKQDTSRPVHECVLCKKTFKRKFNLERHEYNLHIVPKLSGEANFARKKISQCGTSSFEQNPSKPMLECVHCKKIFKRKFDLKRHTNNFHPLAKALLLNVISESDVVERKRSYGEELFPHESDCQRHALGIDLKSRLFEGKCRQEEFSEDVELSSHRRVHIREKEEKQYQCEVCMKKFRTRCDIKKHVRVHSGERPYQCDICTKWFSQKNTLIIHKRAHTGDKPYKCEICGKRFVAWSLLKGHKRVHTGEKPYQCDICMKRFTQKTGLNSHMRVHTGEKSFECEICMRKFRERCHLNEHIRVHTGEKPYQCDICMKRYSKSSALTEHKKIHTGEKPYECKICMKRFSKRFTLNQHNSVHNVEKPYQCKICMKKYNVKKSLKRHKCIIKGETV